MSKKWTVEITDKTWKYTTKESNKTTAIRKAQWHVAHRKEDGIEKIKLTSPSGKISEYTPEEINKL